MIPDRWTDVFAVFDAALAASSAERDALLARECGDNARLREKVESLLAAHREAEGFLSSAALRAQGTTDPAAPAPGALVPGTLLGAFEIERFVGAGGMGEVYRARDTRLDRHVAIKVLPREAAADPRGRARCTYEARAIARLSHPHICALHDFGHHEGIDFLVMEFLDGETLASRLRNGPMSIADAVRIAIQIAEALAAAHAEGIVHRDLKPANVMLVDGRPGRVARPEAKLLDFGLAVFHAASLPEAAGTPATRAGSVTRGTIAGTPQYMAPEQVRGEEADPRTDIFAFGSVLYEMLARHPPFSGGTADEIMSAVLDADPPKLSTRRPRSWLPTRTALRKLEKIIGRCLEKEPDLRFTSVNEVRLELERIASVRGYGTARIDRGSGKLLAGGVALVTSAVCVVAWSLWPRETAERASPPMRVVQLTALNGLETGPMFSPDGKQVAFSWNGEREDNYDIYVKTIGSSDVRRLTTDPAVDTFPVWSPDGHQIAFLRDHPGGGTVIHAVVSSGGGERKLSDFRIGGGGSARIAWSPDGRAVVGRPDLAEDVARNGLWALYLIPLDGGAPRRLTGSTAPDIDMAPAFSPDGRSLAYAACTKLTRRVCDINVIDLDSGYAPAGPPRRLVNVGQHVRAVAWARDGRSIVYDTNARGLWELWRVSRDGGTEAERLELAGDHSRHPAIAAAGDRLVFERLSELVNVFRLVENGPPEPMLVSSASDSNPRFSPDGRRIAFSSGRSGTVEEIWLAAADGSRAQQLTTGPGSRQSLPTWSPDGRQIAFESRDANGGSQIWIIPAEGGIPRRATTDFGEENAPLWSRDGRRIYFLSDRGGQGLWGGHDAWQVPAEGGPATRVTEGGSAPVMYESADGKELIHQRGLIYESSGENRFTYQTFGDGPLWAVPVAGGPARQVLPCVRWLSFAVTDSGIHYSPCGDRRDRNQTNGFLQTWLAGSEVPIQLLDSSTGRTRIVGSVKPPFDSARLGVSHDGRTVLVHRTTGISDLMAIENFR
jgi:Tol biopolymer transport system component/serine/threonine protein kinase